MMNDVQERSISGIEESLGRPLNFLEDHYIRCRESGLSHGEYICFNDLSDETSKEFSDLYEKYTEIKGVVNAS